jgi:hypothetical protein
LSFVQQENQPDKVLNLFYLANDILQRSTRSENRDCAPYISAFAGVLRGAVEHFARIASPQTAAFRAVKRVLGIWKKRAIFPQLSVVENLAYVLRVDYDTLTDAKEPEPAPAPAPAPVPAPAPAPAPVPVSATPINVSAPASVTVPSLASILPASLTSLPVSSSAAAAPGPATASTSAGVEGAAAASAGGGGGWLSLLSSIVPTSLPVVVATSAAAAPSPRPASADSLAAPAPAAATAAPTSATAGGSARVQFAASALLSAVAHAATQNSSASAAAAAATASAAIKSAVDAFTAALANGARAGGPVAAVPALGSDEVTPPFAPAATPAGSVAFSLRADADAPIEHAAKRARIAE